MSPQFVFKTKDFKSQLLVFVLMVGDTYSIFMIEMMEELLEKFPYLGCKSQQSSIRGKEKINTGKKYNKGLRSLTISLTTDHFFEDWAKFSMFSEYFILS